MRIVVVLVSLAMVAGIVAVAVPAVASAQPGSPGSPGRPIPEQLAQLRPQVAPTPPPPADRDKQEGTGGWMAALFWVVALGSVGGSIFVITRRNLIAAVMGMVATFFAVAAVYMMLYASFLAVIQVLVYAGAIMVLFVFVVMILNKPEDEPWGLVGIPGKILAGLAMLYLMFRLTQTLWGVKPPDQALAAPRPVPVVVGVTQDPETGQRRLDTERRDWGSTAAVGTNLFDDYLFPFEAVSILLLVGVVGGGAIARPLKDDESGESDPEVTA
jgi:NADH-quinone oxidoreductase subunit J